MEIYAFVLMYICLIKKKLCNFIACNKTMKAVYSYIIKDRKYFRHRLPKKNSRKDFGKSFSLHCILHRNADMIKLIANPTSTSPPVWKNVAVLYAPTAVISCIYK